MADRAQAEPATANVRNVYVFGATSLLNDTASEMAYWVLPAFLKTLGAGPMQLGIIEGIAESVASFAKLFSGYLADRFPRRKPMVVAGYAVANVAKPFLAIASSWWQVLLVRFADRLAKGVRGAPRDVMVAESVPSERHGSAFGLLQAMDTAGAIVGPLLAVAILLHYDLRTVFLAAAVPGLLSVVVVALLARETRAGNSPKRVDAGKIGDSKAGLRLPGSARLGGRFYYLLFVTGLFSVGNSSDMFLVLRAQRVGFETRIDLDRTVVELHRDVIMNDELKLALRPLHLDGLPFDGRRHTGRDRHGPFANT